MTLLHSIAGSTNVSFRPHKFHVQYMEQAGAEDFTACHRALSVNPLFAEGTVLLSLLLSERI